MAALDFPNSPTSNQQYAAPNGVTYQWDGAAWVVTGGPPGQLWTGSGSTLIPTDPAKTVTISPTTDYNPLVVGRRTAKGRLVASGSADTFDVTANASATATAWVQDNTALPSWLFVLNPAAGGDVAALARIAPGGTVPTTLLTLGATGQMVVAGTAGTDCMTLGIGSTSTKAHFSVNGPGATAWYSNMSASAVLDDATKPSWQILLGNNDNVAINRAPAGSASMANLAFIDNAGDLVLAGPIGQKSTGTTWANPSDRRLKDDIADYATGLAAVVALSPRTFVYNGKGGSQAGLRGYGYIADEVAAVMPEMLGTTRAKLNADDAEETDIQTLDTSNVILALVNAVKELAARVVALEPHA